MPTLEERTENLIQNLDVPLEFKTSLSTDLKNRGLDKNLLYRIRGLLGTVEAQYMEEVKAWEKELQELDQQIKSDHKAIAYESEKQNLEEIRKQLGNL